MKLGINFFKWGNFFRKDGSRHIEFYLCDAFEISHFLPIHKILNKHGIDAVFVAEPPEHNVAGNWFDYDRAIDILRSYDIAFETKCSSDARIAFTTQRVNLLMKYKNAIKINMPYGVGLNKSYWGYSQDAMVGFDYKFVHGLVQKELCIKRCILDENRIKIIGYPKYYDYSQEAFMLENIKKKLHINTGKKILMYFPTWDDDSCVQCFSEVFRDLREKYFIITKPHHCTFRLEEKEKDMKAIVSFSDLVLDGNFDFPTAALLGDINVCDAKSGASTEVKLLNPQAPIYFLSNRKNLDEYFLPIAKALGGIINSPEIFYRYVIDNVVKGKEFDMNTLYDSSVNESRLVAIMEEIIYGTR